MFTKRELSNKNPYICMRVHLIKEQTIQEYAAHHARSRSSFTNWLGTVRYADWKEPGDINHTYSSADLLGNGSN